MGPAGIRSHARLIDPGSPSGQPFRMLRLALDLRREALSGNCVLFTSAEQSVGKSTLAANFALVSSLTCRSTVIVDCDTRRPALHEIFNVPRTPGLVDALAADGELEAHGYRGPGLGRLLVVPAGSSLGGSVELGAGSRMQRLVQAASAEHDLVVLDSPPLLAASEASAIASLEGVDVVVVTTPTTRRRHLSRALRQLALVEASVAGIVVNREGKLSTYGY